MARDDIQYLSWGLELAARLRDMSFNVDDDLDHIAAGGKLLYCIDPQIIDVLVDPINSLVDVDLFGRTRDDARKSREFLGENQRGTLLSIASLFYLSLVGDDRTSRFQENILLIPAYDNEVRAAILHYRRAAQYVERSSSRIKPYNTPDQMQDNLRTIEDAIDRHNSQKASTLDTYATILENMSGALTYALVPEEQTPLARLRTMVSRGLFTSEREILKNIKPPQGIRETSLYDRCADQLYTEKRHVLEIKNSRSERDLRLAVTTDAQAIVSVVLLNEYFRDKKLKQRAIFLTADSTILKLFSSAQNRQRILSGNYDENFVRSPLEIPALFAPKELGRQKDGLLKRIRYFDYFLEIKSFADRPYRSYLNSVRFHEEPVYLPDLRNISGLPSHIIRGVEYELRDVLRAFEGAIAKRAIQGLQQFISTVQERLSKYAADISAILERSWEASDAISDGLSQLLGVSLLYGSPSSSRRDLMWVLNSAIREAGSQPLQGPSFPSFRFPCFLKFSSRQLDYFKTLLAEKTAAEDIFTGLSALHRGELTLANAFLCGVAGDWRKAERLAWAARQLDNRRPGSRRRSDYALRDEAVYFRAVAVRHSAMPSPSRWEEAAVDLKKTVERDTKRVDLRFLVEYAVLGLSVPYHAYYYKKVEYSRIFHPDARQTRVLFDHAARRFEAEYGNNNSELATRLGTQIYTNLCLLFVHDEMIQPKLQSGVSRVEAQNYLEALEVHITRTSWHPVSYFVALIHRAVSLEFSKLDAQSRLSLFDAFIVELERQNDRWIIGYDRKKIQDLREYFASQV